MGKTKQSRAKTRRDEIKQKEQIETVIWEREVTRANEEWIAWGKQKEEELQEMHTRMQLQQDQTVLMKRRLERMEEITEDLKGTIQLKQRTMNKQKEKIKQMENEYREIVKESEERARKLESLEEIAQN